MAILNSLIVSGASRFLNTAYFQDVSISGTATLSSLSLSGNLSVTGTSTLSGHVSVGGYNNTSYGLSANSAIINNWIRTVGSTGWYNESHGGGWWMKDNDYIRSYNKPVLMDHNIYFGTAGDSGYYVKTTGAAKFASVAAPAATISTVNTTNLSVSNNLRAAHFDLQTVAQLGGSFYVSPTVKFPNSGTTLTVAKSESTLTLTITDSSITSTTMAGIVWSANSHVKVSGTINGVVTGTMDGTVSSINTSSHVLTLSVSGENSASVVAGTYSASQFSNLTVMIYQRRDGSNDYRVGIWMNCYDVVNSSSTIRIYGGSDTNPNVMLGNLTSAGLGTINNLTPTGWGLFAQNAFLHGKVVANGGLIGNWTIGESSMYYSSDAPSNSSIVLAPGGKTASVDIGGSGTAQKSWVFTVKNLFGVDTSGALYSSSGKIGGWNIGTSSLYNTTNSMTSTGVGLYLGTDGIRNYASGTQYVNITSGKITALGVDVSGKITATSGAIGGWNIGTSSLYSGTHSAYNSNVDGIFMDSTYLAGGKQAMWYLKNDGSAKIGALTLSSAGVLAVPAANITGTLSADHIDTSSITIGQSQVDGLSTALGNKANSSTVTALSNKVTAVYGTCDTAANTQVKNVTCSNFEYYDGALITVAFSTANTYNVSTIRLNVNSKGQKNIKVANVITAADNCLLWGAGAVITFRYDGDYFVVVGEPRTWYGASTTAANTYVKTDTTAVAGCVVCKGTVVSLSMQHDNTATTPLLNIAGTGNIELYAGDGTTTRPTTANGLGWTAGSTAQFIFDGQYWRVGDTSGLARAYSAQSTANTANTNATNAAKTATNFITADGTNGIKIHKTSNTTDYSQITTDYVQIISDGTHIYKGSNDVACFGDTARIGRIANGIVRTQIDSDSFDVIKRSSDTDTTLATFGAETIIGNLSTRGVRISDDGFLFRANSNDAFTVGIDSRTGSTDETRNATTYDLTRTIDGITYYRIAQISTGESVLSAGYGTPPWELEPDSMITGASGYVGFYVDDDRYLWVTRDPTDDGTEDWEGVSYLVSGVIGQINNPYYCFGKFEPAEGFYDPGKYGLSHGRNCYPVGEYSISSGNSCGAMNAYSFARGRDAWARGIFAVACGDSCVADADYGMAIGYQCHAYASNSIAIGRGRVATKVGSISIGDYQGSTESFIVDGVANWDSTNSVWNFTMSGVYYYIAQIIKDGSYLGDFYNPKKLVRIWNVISRTETSSGVYTIVVKSYSDDTSMYHDGDTVRFYVNPSGSYSQGSVSIGNSLSKAEFGTALGQRTIISKTGGLAIGSYNSIEGSDSLFVVGGGYSEYNRSDLFRVDGRGNVWAAGKVMAENTSHVGMIIQSTTLDTMAKVIAVYGGTTWIQHSGYFLYGATSGVTSNHAAADGGEYTHTLTINEMPSHGHRVFSYYAYNAGQWDGLIYQSMYNDYHDRANGGANFIENTGGGQAHNNMPPYKQVYIWERTA